MFDSIDKLETIQNILKEKRKTCDHKYKRLHYTYIISRIKDRIHEIQYNQGNEATSKENFFWAIDPGDLMLISYFSK